MANLQHVKLLNGERQREIKNLSNWFETTKEYLASLDQQLVCSLHQKSHKERVEFFLRDPSSCEFIQEKLLAPWMAKLSSLINKDFTIAEQYRNAGNQAYYVGNYEEAVYGYTLAIANAPKMEVTISDSEEDRNKAQELPLALGNRSAAYARIGEYDCALKDIDAALEQNYEIHRSVIKLQLRKCDCLIQLGRIDEAKAILSQLSESECVREADRVRWEELREQVNSDDTTESDNQQLLQQTEQSLKCVIDSTIQELTQKGLYQSNPKLSSLSAKVELHYHPSKGRYLMAKEDIDFGQALAVVKPYISVLNAKYELCFCHHCTRSLQLVDDKKGLICSHRSLPCESCSTVLFCSEKCRIEAWNLYHRFECAILPILHQDTTWHLATRILLSVGLENVKAIVNTMCGDNTFALKDTIDMTDVVDPEDYSHIVRMNGHASKWFAKDLCTKSFISCALVHVMKNVGFFGAGEKADDVFVALTLLRHILVVSINSMNIIRSSTDTIGAGLYPTTFSLVNHSCDANASLLQNVRSDGHMSMSVMQALRPIAAGEEVTISYMQPNYFTARPRFQRQIELRRKYFFTCNCSRCTTEARDWPVGSVGCYHPIGCGPHCDGIIERKNGQSFKCSNCDAEVSVEEMKAKYATNNEHIAQVNALKSTIDQLFDAGRYPTTELATMEELIQKQLGGGGLLHRGTSWQLAKLLNLLSLMHFQFGGLQDAKACAELEQSTRILERVYGPASEQVLEQLKKMQNLYMLILEDFFTDVQDIFGMYEQYRFIAARVDHLESRLVLKNIVYQRMAG